MFARLMCWVVGVGLVVAGLMGGRALAQPTTRPATEPQLAPEVKQERDRLLTQADGKIRKGLTELAQKFPQLNQTSRGSLQQALARPEPPGAVLISVARYPAPTTAPASTTAPAGEATRFDLLVAIRPISHGGPMAMLDALYPNLHLGGQINISAGDPQLEAALKQLVEDALAPLDKLNTAAGGK